MDISCREAGGAGERGREVGCSVARGIAFADGIVFGERIRRSARVAAFKYRSLPIVRRHRYPAQPRRVLISTRSSPAKFGRLLRCADGAGAPHVVIPKDRSASVTPTVIKSSAGAAHHVKVYRVTNLRQTMQQLKDRGFWLVGLDAGAPTSIYDRTYPEMLGIVVGSEGRACVPLCAGM